MPGSREGVGGGDSVRPDRPGDGPEEGVELERLGEHRDQGVRALGLPLVAQPPASPELNPAERVCAELRRAVEGKVCATLADKVAAVGAELARIEANPDLVRRLTGRDWITAAVQQLPRVRAA